MLTAKQVTAIAQSNASYLRYNYDLIQIFEGNLLPYVDKMLSDQLSVQSYLQAKHRIFPVNILPKVVDKLTNIYQTTVIRKVTDGTDADEELVNWYVEKLCLDETMNTGNELFNLCRGTLLYPYICENEPCLRPIQNDKFILVGQNPNEPMEPTDVIILAGKKNGRDIYWVFDDISFVVYVDEKIDHQEMESVGNPLGINPYGELPFIWGNESKYCLMPIQDTSTMKVATTIPVMLTDLNLAAMFQTFSIIYGIDIDDENINFAPNAVWKFKSDLASDKKPEIGQIKPQVDIDQVIRLVEAELSMWLGTKGIRPGSIGKLSADNVASGISKVIDEMDTFEARQKQVTCFQKIEYGFWDLLLNKMHPYWVATGQVENRQLFTAGAKVKTEFAVQLPQSSRGAVVRDLMDEVGAGFTTRKSAIQTLNPQFSEEQVDELLVQIEEDKYGPFGPDSNNPSNQSPDGAIPNPAQGSSGSSN